MAERRVLARLRISGFGTQTITLEQVDAAYCLTVLEESHLTHKQSLHRAEVSAALVQERLAALKQLTVPAFPVGYMVCDGEWVELEVVGECSSLTIGWLSDPPKGAEGVAEFADWLREVAFGREEEQNNGND